jgi:hypothetical protein
MHKTQKMKFCSLMNGEFNMPLVFTGFQGMENIWELTGWSYQTLGNHLLPPFQNKSYILENPWA